MHSTAPLRLPSLALTSLGLITACDRVEQEAIDSIHDVDAKAVLPDVDDESEPAFQTEEDALNADNDLAARALHADIVDIERAMEFQDSFGEFQSWISLRHQSELAGSWVDPAPARGGHVRFVGEVPPEVAEELRRRPELHARVQLIPDGRFPLAEHHDQANAAVHALLASGHAGVAAAYDPRTDRLRIRVQSPLEEPVDEAGVLSSLRSHAKLDNLPEHAVEVVVVQSQDPILRLESSLGGAWLRDDGVRECTSGWAVEGPDGDGIITAGHCNGLNQYEPPGGVARSITWRDQVLGNDGDAEYHTTGLVEQPRFYSSAGITRDVTSIRSTNSMVGRTVCVYGRSSNNRTCNHEITLINETVGVQLPNGNVLVRGGLVEATNASTSGGDSGGGWSYGTQAYGTHVGQGGGFSYFFPVEGAETELGVTILTN